MATARRITHDSEHRRTTTLGTVKFAARINRNPEKLAIELLFLTLSFLKLSFLELRNFLNCHTQLKIVRAAEEATH